jgi:hypothetical protein
MQLVRIWFALVQTVSLTMWHIIAQANSSDKPLMGKI